MIGYLNDGTIDFPARESGKRETLPVCRVIAAYESLHDESPHSGIVPIGVPGLDELLFPEMEPGQRGFELPQEGKVVPRVVVIKGAAGTGKTTLATQMMISMARAKYTCDYWCSSDSSAAIRKTALSFGFCSEQEFEDFTRPQSGYPRISIYFIGNEYLDYLALGSKAASRLKGNSVLFFDSLNVSQVDGDHADRSKLWRIFEGFKKRNMLTFFILEDYGQSATLEARQKILDCEFLADIVVELGEELRSGYHTKSICVKKEHYRQQVNGSHFYKINSQLDELSKKYLNKHTGIIVYPSIHRFFSGAQKDRQQRKMNLVFSGMTHFDSILAGGSHLHNDLLKPSLPDDSCIVITGERGGHKLPLGLNLLFGGLWTVDARKGVVPDKNVLIILLDEEAQIDIQHSAIAYDTHQFVGDCRLRRGVESLDNGRWIRWKTQTANAGHAQDTCCLRDVNTIDQKGTKVILYQVCADIGALRAKPDKGSCRKVVVAGFRPGCITPEEFIYIVKTIIESGREAGAASSFGRVLFISTAHLIRRFPLLRSEKLFIPALVDLFKAKGLISLFVDVIGQGYDEELSYAITNLADYLISIDSIIPGGHIKIEAPHASDLEKDELVRQLRENKRRYVWSKMRIENVRGKEYSQYPHAVTVNKTEKNGALNNYLYIVNFEEGSGADHGRTIAASLEEGFQPSAT